MDVLYIVGTGSKWRNNELKYSLRSIDKYGKNIDRMFIVGYKPDFINDNVIHIPCEDIGPNKHSRILNKVLTAIKNGLLSDHFLISSDDHFYVNETDFNNLPIYYKQLEIKGSNKNEYNKSLLETKKFLLQNNLTIYQTNPHCNTHFDVNIYNKYKDLFDKGMLLPNGIEMNCLMGNLLIKEGFQPESFRDNKIKRIRSKLEFLDKIKNSECFSIYDSAIDCGVGSYLSEMFSNKSKYEK